jgi:hypothetical protein
VRRRRSGPVVVPAWSNLGIGFQLMHGETFGALLGDDSAVSHMPREDVLRASWVEYRERVEAMCPAGVTPWAARFDNGSA